MNWPDKLKSFLHDPIDKCFDIATHENRSEEYAKKIGVTNVRESKGPDQIASCMERSLLPKDIKQEFNEIRHPLSDGKLNVLILNKNEIFSAIEEVFDQLNKGFSNKDDKYKFFYLWRNLQEEISAKNRDNHWIKYLGILPADTRVPDHSIWEHLKIASALSAFWDSENKILHQNNSLFLFTLGPVQSFISQARKTQDFYMGSFILSYLTFKAMEVIISEFGPTNIIYPDLYKQPLVDMWIRDNLKFSPIGFSEDLLQLPTIPNRFVAFLPETNKDKIVELIERMRTQVLNTLNDAKKLVFNKLEVKTNREIDEKIDSQLGEFPEIYWVAIPWKIDNRDISFEDIRDYFEDRALQQYQTLQDFATKYGEFPPNIGLLYELLYSALEKSLGARKNIRVFKQFQIEEKGRKCSICGERDVIFFRESNNKNKFLRFNKNIVDLTDNEKIGLKYLAEGEGLCALCFIKRTFEIYLKEKVSKIFKDLSFPSTAEVSSSNFKEKALCIAREEYFEYQNKFKKFCEKYQIQFPKVSQLPKLRKTFNNKENLEGYWFYEENLTIDKIYEELGIKLSEREIQELMGSYKQLISKVGKPNPYYAIIYLDGDNMGKWLSGELLPEIEHAYNSETWEKLKEIKIEEKDKNRKTIFTDKLKEILSQKPLTPAIHASISTALRNYALEIVRKIVEEEHLGKLVYAGGDDILAFVNLKDLFDIIHKLRWAFSGCIKIENNQIKVDLNNKTGFVEKGGMYLLTMGNKATASMGVVVAHYKAPLQIVIRKLFEMKKIAKKIDGEKNGFAICLMRRSGEERVAKAKWMYRDKINVINILKEIGDAFNEENEKGHISKSFIQKIASDFIHLKQEGCFIASSDIFNKELSRLLKKSYNSAGEKRISKEEQKEFLEKIERAMECLFWSIGGDIDNFINFCTITLFTYQKED